MPRDLRLVATLFIILGIGSAIDVLVSLLNSHLNLNFAVLQIPIGFGLLSLKRQWRRWATIYLAVGLVLLIVVSMWMVSLPYRPFAVRIFGQKVGDAPPEMAFAFVAGIIILTAWMYRVLTRPSTRELFDANSG